MASAWNPLVAEPSDAAVRSTTLPDSQPWCNFPVLAPAKLPNGLRVEEVTLRPEAPPGRRGVGAPDWTEASRSSVRAILSDGRRRIRLKQFLYDWAPPAFDHPALWRSEVRPVPVDDDVAWLGRDYLGREAGTLIAGRTTVELSVEAGEAGDDLVSILRGLRPVWQDARRAIDATPFAALAWGRRHPERSIEVPTGYWRHRREPEGARVEWLLPVEADFPAPAVPGYEVDGVAVLREGGRTREREWVFRTAADAGPRLRILVLPDDAWPPRLDEQPCRSGLLRTSRGEWFHAWGTEAHGPHEAVGRRGDEVLIVLAKPGPETDVAWFARLLEEL